jgi:hypothetical protein
MSEPHKYPVLHFREPFNERVAWEVTYKGWYSGVVELEDGSRYSVFFYDPVRLTQELNDVIAQGQSCIAEQGMIVLSEVTEVNMRAAIAQLHREGWFAHLKPINERG